MPALAGIIFPDIFQVSPVLEPMMQVMAHRGDHSQNEYSFQNLQLGVRGGELHSNDKKSVVAMIDGHLYNTESLCTELKKQGYQIPACNPGQVLICAYEAWGEESFKKLNGEFAIVLFDRRNETLFLLRDRIGSKPLYWYHEQNHFLFASELKGLLSTGIVPQTPALDALAAYLSMGYTPQDMSPIDKVNKLLPAHFLKFRLGKGKVIHPYWSYSKMFASPEDLPPEEIAEELSICLKKSLQKRIPKKTPLGCMISGGLGSATISSLVKELPLSQNAFTVGFSEQNDEDTRAAISCCNALQIPHYVKKIQPKNLFEDSLRSLWYLDEPLADPNIFATWQLAKEASQKCQVVFSGMGSDELLAGHSRYSGGKNISRLKLSLQRVLQPFVQKCIVPSLYSFNPSYAFQALRASRTNPWQGNYLKQTALFGDQILKNAAPTLNHLFNPEIFLQKFHHIDRLGSMISSIQYFDVKTRLPDFYILQYERLTTALGLSWRAPFLDNEVVEFLAKTIHPLSLNTQTEALPLKKLLANTLPQEFIQRPKKTRSQFLNSWLKSAQIAPLFQHLRDGALVESGILSPSWISHALSNEKRMKRYFSELWTLLMLEVWFRLFIHRSPLAGEPKGSIMDLLK